MRKNWMQAETVHQAWRMQWRQSDLSQLRPQLWSLPHLHIQLLLSRKNLSSGYSFSHYPTSLTRLALPFWFLQARRNLCKSQPSLRAFQRIKRIMHNLREFFILSHRRSMSKHSRLLWVSNLFLKWRLSSRQLSLWLIWPYNRLLPFLSR